MILDVHVGLNIVATLYRERDEYELRYRPEAVAADFMSLAMPVREAPWKWPRDLHPTQYHASRIQPHGGAGLRISG